MDSLVGYGSDDDNENDRYESYSTPVPRGGGGVTRTKEDDTNYDDVNMDLSEDSQAESEPELPPAEEPPRSARPDQRLHEARRDTKPRDERRREDPGRRDDRHGRYEREGRGEAGGAKRGLLGDRPDERPADKKFASLSDRKPTAGSPHGSSGSYDARDAVSPRFAERRDNRDKDRERDRDKEGKDRDRDSKERRDRDRDSKERRDRDSKERRERDSKDSRERDRESRESKGSRERERDSRDKKYRSDDKRAAPPRPRGPRAPEGHYSHSEPRVNPAAAGASSSGEFRSTSYKVNKKLEVMEKMGLQIKTPDGSMATAQQLRRAAHDAPPGAAPYGGLGGARLDQVQKRKLLWSNKSKSEAEEAAKWSGTRFAQDNDGRQASKFMRLMGIKDPAAVAPEAPAPAADPIKKQEELFQAMQQQYEVARAATHTMRGVGLGFQRGPF